MEPFNYFSQIKKFLRHPLIYGSSVVVIGGIAVNFFHFLFNIFMSRNLSVADYGTLASIILLITFPGMVAAALTPLVVSYAGEFFARGQYKYLRGFYFKIFKFLLIIGSISFFVFLAIIPYVSSFLNISNYIILILADFIVFLMFMGIVNIALLQAKLAFGQQVFINFLGAVSKLILGIIFVFAGFSVTGSVVAVVISSVIVYVASFIPIRFIFDKKLIAESVIDTKELFKYGIPSALTLLGLTSLISTDVILAKHFFDSQNAGIYAGMSLIGRVIFYISAPIATVMFPIIVRKHANNKNFNRTVLFSLFLVSVPSVLLTVFYFIFPEFSILFFLKKSEYLSIVPVLGIFGIFLSLYSVLFILANFYLSVKKTKVYIPILIGAISQIILITLYHQSFFQIIINIFSIIFIYFELTSFCLD